MGAWLHDVGQFKFPLFVPAPDTRIGHFIDRGFLGPTSAPSQKPKSNALIVQAKAKLKMNFKDLAIQGTYSSEESNILRDFYIPVLEHSVAYDRAVGYFSASMLSYAAQGLTSFVKNQGKMRLLIGDPLELDEYDAVKKGLSMAEALAKINKKLDLILNTVDSEVFKNRLDILSWLVAAGRLEIKIAITVRGLYHEKIGIFSDSEGNQLIFSGSANETSAALLPDFNFESIAAYPSWKDEIFEEYGKPIVERFERLWSGIAKKVITINLPSEAYEQLKKFYDKDVFPDLDFEKKLDIIDIDSPDDPYPNIPTYFEGHKYALMSHQESALNEWRARDFMGIMALATGAGKTITAIHAGVKLALAHRDNHNRNFVLVVSVPYQVLADQWCLVMEKFNIRAIRCYKDKQIWQAQLSSEVSDLTLSEKPKFLAAVVVNATLAKEEFQEQMSRISSANLMFVGDECHHHGLENVSKKLPKARYRLGLSATPWSNADELKKSIISEYYGAVIATYSLEDALRDKVLTPYNYIMHRVYLEEDESESYVELSYKISQLYAIKQQGGKINEDELMHLYMSRMRILGSANQKFTKLKSLVNKSAPSQNTLFYCGDGSTTEDGSETPLRDVERVTKILANAKWKTSRFTAQESNLERNRIIENFKMQHIDAVVAIRVLDEGFDIPACESAYILASSRNERQFIQRRGRILRRAPGKTKSFIHDFIVLPSPNDRTTYLNELVGQEIERAIEFNRFALDQDDNWSILKDISNDYDLDIEDLYNKVLLKEVVVE